MAYIIAFVSQKGGVGKSTLSRAFAREAIKNGYSCKIADLDTQQRTTVEWQGNRARFEHEPRIPVEVFSTARQALAEAKSFDVFILDCPARTSEATLQIAELADMVVQPTGASLDDLVPAVREFNALVKKGIPRQKLTFALNHIGTKSEDEQTREYLSEASYHVLAGCLREKPAYRQAQNNGLAVNETRYKALNDEADRLIEAIIDRLVEASNG